jgi:NAD-dependent dihydropyrimidine dehydrogenase PreA subunit
MEREMVKINEERCDGCGLCIPGCHEGALQVIDGKARLISDLMCDGLGACLGHCPQGAISIEKREAVPYDEASVMALMVPKGKNTIIAHLKHLKEHNEIEYLRAGVMYLRSRESELTFDLQEVINAVHATPAGREPVAAQEKHAHVHEMHAGHGGGCPGSQSRIIERPKPASVNNPESMEAQASELRQWPVQMHLVNPQAPYFKNADVLIAADCVAFAMGDFHSRHLKGKSLAIACPKLDSNTDTYISKITAMIDYANINTITVMIMQVPCCGGLLQMVKNAAAAARRKVPVKLLVVSLEGNILQEEWV